jgi:acyl-ACP thioesterase
MDDDPLRQEMESTREKFQVRSFDTDALGWLTAPRLLGYLLEAAGKSADSLGVGLAALRGRGLTWVLGRLQVAIGEPLQLGDAIEVETWPSGLVRSAAWRDFRVSRSGHRAAQATSVWFALDLQTRAPVRPQELFPERLHAPLDHERWLSKSVPELSGLPGEERTYPVRRADIDLNHHVTAASYVTWAMEAVPEPLWATRRLGSLDTQYLEECHFGDTVVSSSSADGVDAILHRISRQSDGGELARLRGCARRDGPRRSDVTAL